MAQRSSCPRLRQPECPGPGWHLPTGEAVLPAGWMADPLTVGPSHPRLSADECWMPGCPTVEAACLPRPRSRPLPSSLRSPLLHEACITQGFASGNSKPPAHYLHAPAFQLSNSPDQPTWPKDKPVRKLRKERDTWSGTRLRGNPFLPLRGSLDLASKKGRVGERKVGKSPWVVSPWKPGS